MPVVPFSEELIAAYLDAKVILTVRENKDIWYESIINTIWTGTYLLSFLKSTLQSFIRDRSAATSLAHHAILLQIQFKGLPCTWQADPPKS
jgi:Sulfotransferase domain